MNGRMQETSLVLTQLRKSSEYNDFVGRYYHFPDKYLSQFKALPIQFIYYEGPEHGDGVYFWLRQNSNPSNC